MPTSRVTKWESDEGLNSGGAYLITRFFDFGDVLSYKNIYNFYISFNTTEDEQDEIAASVKFRLKNGDSWKSFGAMSSVVSGNSPYIICPPTSAFTPAANVYHVNGNHRLIDIQTIQFKILFYFQGHISINDYGIEYRKLRNNEISEPEV